MNVTFWFLMSFGGAAAPIDIVERFTTEHYCESVRKALPAAQQSLSKCVQATVAQETGELHVVDHIVPKINPLVCGLHVPANLQVLHWRVNTQKANLWWPDMWAAMIAAVPAPPASAEGV